MNSLTFILILASVNFGTSENSTEIECIVSYLNDAHVLKSADFVNLTNNKKNENCDSFVNFFMITFNNSITTQLQKDDNKTCIHDLLIQHRIFDFYLKGLVYHTFNLTLVLDFYKEASETTSDILKAIQSLCTAEERYGKIFDESLIARNENIHDIVDSSTQLCVKKYYLENKILDPSEYNIDVSAIHATNCEEIVMELDDVASHGLDIEKDSTLYGLPSVDVQKCNNRKFVDEKVLLKLASFNVAIRLDLSKEQEKNLKSDYINWMTANVRFLLKCLERLME